MVQRILETYDILLIITDYWALWLLVLVMQMIISAKSHTIIRIIDCILNGYYYCKPYEIETLLLPPYKTDYWYDQDNKW